MPVPDRIVFCTRGSALALAQTYAVVAGCQVLFPKIDFHIEIIATTGDQLQHAALAQRADDEQALPKGLFTKELEVVLLEGKADIAVHSLKDLPTELPAGLMVAATPPRADVRDVLLYRDRAYANESQKAAAPAEWSPGSKARWGGTPGLKLAGLPEGGCVATSSTRRAAQVQKLRPDLTIIPIRGNVGTRLQKLADDSSFDATLLAAAGLGRLGLFIAPQSRLTLDPRLPTAHRCVAPPSGLMATSLDEGAFLPAVGQGAVALETQVEARPMVRELCLALNHVNTFSAITAERAFLKAMGGGCQSPIGAYARVVGHQLWLRAGSFAHHAARFAEGRLPVAQAVALGERLAAELR